MSCVCACVCVCVMCCDFSHSSPNIPLPLSLSHSLCPSPSLEQPHPLVGAASLPHPSSKQPHSSEQPQSSEQPHSLLEQPNPLVGAASLRSLTPSLEQPHSLVGEQPHPLVGAASPPRGRSSPPPCRSSLTFSSEQPRPLVGKDSLSRGATTSLSSPSPEQPHFLEQAPFFHSHLLRTSRSPNLPFSDSPVFSFPILRLRISQSSNFQLCRSLLSGLLCTWISLESTAHFIPHSHSPWPLPPHRPRPIKSQLFLTPTSPLPTLWSSLHPFPRSLCWWIRSGSTEHAHFPTPLLVNSLRVRLSFHTSHQPSYLGGFISTYTRTALTRTHLTTLCHSQA